MSRKHLGMLRPIRQFNKAYFELLELIKTLKESEDDDSYPYITPDRIEYLVKEQSIKDLNERFNNCLIQLNNIKNTQLEYLNNKKEEQGL